MTGVDQYRIAPTNAGPEDSAELNRLQLRGLLYEELEMKTPFLSVA